MQLLFLNRHTLQYKDNAYVSTEYEIVLDMVLIKHSSFKVNKTNILCDVGDIVVCKTGVFSYIGILETIEKNDDQTTLIKTLDFKDIFSIDVPVSSFQGDLVDFLYQLIIKHFKTNSDDLQNLVYLSVIKNTSVFGIIDYESNSITSMSKIFEYLSKNYSIGYKTKVLYLRGRITGIEFLIDKVDKGITLKSKHTSLLNVKTNDSTSQVTNKAIFYPRDDNETYQNIRTFYLLKNGEVTEDGLSDKRYEQVVLKSAIYTDKDFETLTLKAQALMTQSRLDHNITFTIDMNNKIIAPFKNINLGDYISFIHHGKSYDSLLTAIQFKNSIKYASMTLGEYRGKITEKIQLLKTQTAQSETKSVVIQKTNIDGGEF